MVLVHGGRFRTHLGNGLEFDTGDESCIVNGMNHVNQMVTMVRSFLVFVHCRKIHQVSFFKHNYTFSVHFLYDLLCTPLLGPLSEDHLPTVFQNRWEVSGRD